MSKLTLYELIKGDITDDGLKMALVENFDTRAREIKLTLPKDRARLFLLQETRHEPEWLTYLDPIIDEELNLGPTQTLGAILLAKPANNAHFYAFCWGTGRFLMRSDARRSDLGIYCALNILSGGLDPSSHNWKPDCLRSITSKRVDANTLSAHFQYARLAPFEDFPFLANTDQLRSVTGTPIDKDTWGTVTGGVSLNFKSPAKPEEILDICQKINDIMVSQKYQEHFEFIDNVKPVSDPDQIKLLQNKILDLIKTNKTSSFFISPPDVLDWASISSFMYKNEKDVEKKIDEPEIESLLTFLEIPEIKKNLSDTLFSDSLTLLALDDTGNKVGSWPIYNWIGCEFTYESLPGTKEHFVTDGGSFYKINANYIVELDKFVSESEIETTSPEYAVYNLQKNDVKVFPPWYNTAQAQNAKNYPEDNYVFGLLKKSVPGSLRLHKRLVSDKKGISGITTPIEICDVALDNPKRLVHLKVGTGSESLSHLFSQASVSAELLETNTDFKEQTGEIVEKSKDQDNEYNYSSDSFKWLNDPEMDTHDVTVVMGVITDKTDSLASTMPFFSRVNYRMRCMDLKKMGYQYKMVKIPFIEKT